MSLTGDVFSDSADSMSSIASSCKLNDSGPVFTTKPFLWRALSPTLADFHWSSSPGKSLGARDFTVKRTLPSWTEPSSNPNAQSFAPGADAAAVTFFFGDTGWTLTT